MQSRLLARRNGTTLVAPKAERTHMIDLTNITAVDRDTLWAVANDVTWASSSEKEAGSIEGRVLQYNTGLLLHSTDGGQTWKKRLVVPGSFLSCIRFTPENAGYVTGDRGLVLGSKDGGRNWVKQTTPTTGTLWDIQFVGPHLGWILGSDGKIIHTEDGGAHWTLQTVTAREEVLFLSFGDKANGWALGGKGNAYQSIDGGKTWRARGPDLFALPANWGATTVQPRGVTFLNAKTGFVAANFLAKDGTFSFGVILKTTDGGKNWVSELMPLGIRIAIAEFISQNETWIVPEGGDSRDLLHTRDAGSSWSSVPLPRRGDARRLCIIDSQNGWFINHTDTFSSDEIFQTQDAGKSWGSLKVSDRILPE